MMNYEISKYSFDSFEYVVPYDKLYLIVKVMYHKRVLRNLGIFSWHWQDQTTSTWIYEDNDNQNILSATNCPFCTCCQRRNNNLRDEFVCFVFGFAHIHVRVHNRRMHSGVTLFRAVLKCRCKIKRLQLNWSWFYQWNMSNFFLLLLSQSFDIVASLLPSLLFVAGILILVSRYYGR